jgi:hypothetical protein
MNILQDITVSKDDDYDNKVSSKPVVKFRGPMILNAIYRPGNVLKFKMDFDEDTYDAITNLMVDFVKEGIISSFHYEKDDDTIVGHDFNYFVVSSWHNIDCYYGNK